jgi:periplasmic copper chaperone A
MQLDATICRIEVLDLSRYGDDSYSEALVMNRSARALVMSVGVLAIPVFAHAHVGVVSGPATANTNTEVAFGVGHGCDGADTYRIRVEMPAGVSSILPLTSDFGKITIEKDAAGLITAVTWQKPEADLLPADSEYYKLIIRMRTPNQPFTTIYFPVIQTCKKTDGTLLESRWVGKPGDPPLPDGGTEEPAGALLLMPAQLPGWNKYTVPVAIPNTSLAGWFGKAIIVWKGNAAFSANPATTELIKNTAGVTALDSLAANDEIWVRY